jgi:predicted SprT family Zn-dependent metalloprotease
MTRTDKNAVLQNRFYALIEKAEALFDVDLFHVELRLDLNGYSSLGQACRRGEEMYIRLNTQCVEHYFEDVLEDTLPHEVAHIVQFAKGNRGSHASDWKHYCEALGGRPTRIAEGDYSLLKPARKTRMFQYFVSGTGERVELTIIRHNKLQKGKVAWYSIGGKANKITKECFVQEVQ